MSLTRQHIRAIGRTEINAQAKKAFPTLSRSERRELVRKTQKNSWNVRDRAGIAKAKRYTEQAVEVAKMMMPK